MRMPVSRLPLIAVFVATMALALAGCSDPPAPAEPVRAVRTLVVQPGTAGGSHEYAAEIRARTESRLGFRVSGKMTRRLVDVGAPVKRGQLLAQLDPQDLRLGQDAARAALQAAQVQLDLTAADYARFRDLRDQGFISAAELERRETALKAARAQFEQARAQAGVQGNQAAYTSLVADADGVVTAVEAEPGAVLSAGAPVLRVAHDGPRDAVFAVPEDQIDTVRALVGQPGTISVKAWGNSAQALPATVREVAAAADPATRTFLTKADVGNSPLRLGQTATVAIDIPRREGVTKLPLTAVMEDKGKTSVWVVDPASMTVRVQPIQVAGADGNTVVVADGLSPGQRVVSAGVHVLTAGQKVRLYGEAPAGGAASGASSPKR